MASFVWPPQGSGGGSGTVTSVGLTVPSFLSVSGSPVTTSGTFVVTLSGTALPIANGGTGATSAAAAFNNLDPMTTTGDMIYESAPGVASRLPIGASGNVLTVAGGIPTWAAVSGTGTVTSVALTVPTFLSVSGSPITGAGTLAVTLSGTALPVASGGTAGTTANAGFNNLSPMTTAGDIIYENATPIAARLPIGSIGNVLTVSGGLPVWAPPATSGTVTSVAITVPSFLSVSGSPITGAGTLAVTLSGTALPIANGGTGATSAAAAYNNLSPMTTTGDMEYEVSTGVAARLPIGATGNILTVVGGVPAWAASSGGGTVTSVALTVPSFLSVSGSPITSSGTLAVTLSGTALPIANGGTGQTTAATAFAALSPLTTKGDILSYSTTNVRHAVPADYGSLIADSNQADGWRSTSYTMTQGRPGKNYIQYADFENNSTTGWTLGTIGTLTNGLPTGSPTFGSGASGNLSISIISSGQLSGNFSLSYASSAATTAGNMLASSAYTIDTQDQAKVLTYTFYYSAISGASNANWSGTSSNSYAVAAWDATNSVWLPVTGAFAMTQSTGAGYATGTFQTGSTTASIRFVVYNAAATTGAATVYFDGFYVGPQTSPVGPVITDWQSYTPTFTNFGTVTNNKFVWRREGPDVVISGTVTTGTNGGSTITVTLPPGLTSAGSSIIGSTGVYGIVTQSANNAGGLYVILGSGVTTFNISQSAAANNSLLPLSGTTISNNANLSFYARIPISGWSSNVQMSSDTDTRVVAAMATNATATITASYSSVTWTTVVSDTHGAFNAVSSASIYTIPVTGYYNFNGGLYFSATTITVGQLFAVSLFNVTTSTTVLESTFPRENANATPSIQLYVFNSVFLTAGTQISIQVKSNTTSPVITSSATENYLAISRLSGPAVIAATESVNGRYFSSTTTISGSLATVVFATKGWDTHNAYNGTTGIWTCPTSGKYQFNIAVDIAGTFVLNSTVDLQVQQTGSSSQISESGQFAFASATDIAASVSDEFYCLAGDTIKVQVSSSATAPSIVSSNSKNYISWSRIGN